MKWFYFSPLEVIVYFPVGLPFAFCYGLFFSVAFMMSSAFCVSLLFALLSTVLMITVGVFRGLDFEHSSVSKTLLLMEQTLLF